MGGAAKSDCRRAWTQEGMICGRGKGGGSAMNILSRGSSISKALKKPKSEETKRRSLADDE